MKYLKIANWSRWQSYRKDRNPPPWIKIHKALLMNPEWVKLSDYQRGQLVSLWLLASERDGKVPDDELLLRQLCHCSEPVHIQTFISLGFIEKRRHRRRQSAGSCQPTTEHHDALETETETETETEPPCSPPVGDDPPAPFTLQLQEAWREGRKNSPKKISPHAKEAANTLIRKGYSEEQVLGLVRNYHRLGERAPGYGEWSLNRLLRSKDYIEELMDPDWEGFTKTTEERDFDPNNIDGYKVF